MNKRLKLEVSNHLRAMQWTFIPGKSRSQTPLCAYKKLAANFKQGLNKRLCSLMWHCWGVGRGEPGDLEISGLCRVSEAEQQPP